MEIKNTFQNIPIETIKSMYVTMLRIRIFEEKVAELITNPSEIKCPCHLYTGQEAIATGVCSALQNEDYVFSTHRCHGHYIAKGGSLEALIAELYGRTTGCSMGRGGSMHLASPEIGFPGSSAIVAGTISLAVGAGLSFSIQKNNNVSVAFFGDGAVDEGVFYEALNFASLKKLPVIFVCENNLYSTHMPISSCIANTDIYKIGEAFNIPGVRIDGNNIFEVFAAAKKAIANARSGKGPILLECMTYRWRGHVGPNYDIDKGLRAKEEVDDWMDRCPIKKVEGIMMEKGIMSKSEISKVHEHIENEINESIVFAKDSPHPDECDILSNVFK